MAYRDDDAALRQHHDQLVAELSRLEATLAGVPELESARSRLIDELARVRADLAHHAARRAPVRLHKLRVAAPCKERWADMAGDDRVRACARCERPVFDLSQLTLAEAEAVLATRGVTPCVRFYRRADGTVKTADCPSPRRRLALAVGASALVAGGAAAALSAYVPAPDALAAPRPVTTVIAPEPLPMGQLMIAEHHDEPTQGVPVTTLDASSFSPEIRREIVRGVRSCDLSGVRRVNIVLTPDGGVHVLPPPRFPEVAECIQDRVGALGLHTDRRVVIRVLPR